jgi:hypothetical protein
MANHCGLNTWGQNSIVGLSKSITGKIEGPYAFEKTMLVPFAHNPTIRRANDGTYVVYFIGGWHTDPVHCKPPTDAAAGDASYAAPASSADDCVSSTKLDPPKSIRIGGDYKSVPLAGNATIQDCVASCCADPVCVAFSFNFGGTGGSTKDQSICKHKDPSNKLITDNTCRPDARGVPTCLSGALTPRPTPAPAPVCNGQSWPKSCGPTMPGPMQDCCGPANATYKGNAGCGISIASSKSLDGPWEVQSLIIEDQWKSDEVYCTHTNPSPVFLPNGSVMLAFNAGYCNDHLETVGIAMADSWAGPYTLFEKNAVLRNPDGSPHKCEDPYLWQSKRGWHLITHNQQGPQTVSSYGYSVDGHNWTLSPTTPHTCGIMYTDGTTAEVNGCGNRPQIIWSQRPDAGGSPQVLLAFTVVALPSDSLRFPFDSGSATEQCRRSQTTAVAPGPSFVESSRHRLWHRPVVDWTSCFPWRLVLIRFDSV